MLFLIVGVMVVLISSWLIFCIIDIRDLLREIVTNTSEYKNNEESESKDNTIVNEESNNEELKFSEMAKLIEKELPEDFNFYD